MKQKNQTFQYLKAIAILMVIDDHMSTRIGILSSLFPYNSFYMPLFVFISGYFFRDKGIWNNIKGKAEKLLLPYIIWFYVGQLLSFLLERAGIVYWYSPITNISDTVQYLLTVGPTSSIIGAAWFGIMLFWVAIIYTFLHKVLMLEKPVMSYLFLAVSVIAGFASLQLCMAGYQTTYLRLALLRAIWYLQFFHMGWMFKEHWEKKLEKMPVSVAIGICIVVNVVLICILGDKINFYSTTYMAKFNSWWIPLITSATGILFWYEVMHFIAARVGEVKSISFIADNTFTIMCAHLIFVNIPNLYIYRQILNGSNKYNDFPANDFLGGAWVRYSPNTRLIGFFCGIVGSLLVAYLIKAISGALSGSGKKATK